MKKDYRIYKENDLSSEIEIYYMIRNHMNGKVGVPISDLLGLLCMIIYASDEHLNNFLNILKEKKLIDDFFSKKIANFLISNKDHGSIYDSLDQLEGIISTLDYRENLDINYRDVCYYYALYINAYPEIKKMFFHTATKKLGLDGVYFEKVPKMRFEEEDDIPEEIKNFTLKKLDIVSIKQLILEGINKSKDEGVIDCFIKMSESLDIEI